jgi:hypothetical protein
LDAKYRGNRTGFCESGTKKAARMTGCPFYRFFQIESQPSSEGSRYLTVSTQPQPFQDKSDQFVDGIVARQEGEYRRLAGPDFIK